MMSHNLQTLNSTYVEEYDALKSYIFRLTTSVKDTEDIVQETYLKAEKKIDQFKGQSTLKSWLFSIATNLAKDNFRAKQRWKSDTQDRCRTTTQNSIEKVESMVTIAQAMNSDNYEFTEHINYCFTCLGKSLPIEKQIVLILKEFYSFTNPDISEIAKLTLGQVKYILAEARKDMSEMFNHRCVLVNKKGICYQCSEMSEFVNAPIANKSSIEKTMYKAKEAKQDLYNLRVSLIKHIDPLKSEGTIMHQYLLNRMYEEELT